jgi:hypothetical protein
MSSDENLSRYTPPTVNTTSPNIFLPPPSLTPDTHSPPSLTPDTHSPQKKYIKKFNVLTDLFNSINDIEESETFYYLYRYHDEYSVSYYNFSLSNINVLKLFKLIEEKPDFALPVFLWFDTFHDFKKTRLKTSKDKEGDDKTIKKNKFTEIYRNSFFTNIPEPSKEKNSEIFINKCYTQTNESDKINFHRNVKYTVLKPFYVNNISDRKSYACLLFNLSEMLIRNQDFEKDLLCCYINYFFFGKETILEKYKETNTNYYDIRKYVNKLKNIIQSKIYIKKPKGYARDVEDRHIKDFIRDFDNKEAKLFTVPASLFDKNPKNSTKIPPSIVYINKTIIPFVNGYGDIIYEYNSNGYGNLWKYNKDKGDYESIFQETRQKCDENMEVLNSDDCKLKITVPSFQNNIGRFAPYESTCKDITNMTIDERQNYSMGFSVSEIFDKIYKTYLSENPESKFKWTCADLDWWVSLKRVGDYGQILQAKQLGIPLSTSDNMQLLLSIVSCSSVIWKPTDKLLFYDGENDCFRKYDDTDDTMNTQDEDWLKRKLENYKKIIDNLLLFNNDTNNSNKLNNIYKLLENTCDTKETAINLENTDFINMIIPNKIPNYSLDEYTKYGYFKSNWEFEEEKLKDRKDIDKIYGYVIDPDNKNSDDKWWYLIKRIDKDPVTGLSIKSGKSIEYSCNPKDKEDEYNNKFILTSGYSKNQEINELKQYLFIKDDLIKEIENINNIIGVDGISISYIYSGIVKDINTILKIEIDNNNIKLKYNNNKEIVLGDLDLNNDSCLIKFNKNSIFNEKIENKIKKIYPYYLFIRLLRYSCLKNKEKSPKKKQKQQNIFVQNDFDWFDTLECQKITDNFDNNKQITYIQYGGGQPDKELGFECFYEYLYNQLDLYTNFSMKEFINKKNTKNEYYTNKSRLRSSLVSKFRLLPQPITFDNLIDIVLDQFNNKKRVDVYKSTCIREEIKDKGKVIVTLTLLNLENNKIKFYKQDNANFGIIVSEFEIPTSSSNSDEIDDEVDSDNDENISQVSIPEPMSIHQEECKDTDSPEYEIKEPITGKRGRGAATKKETINKCKNIISKCFGNVTNNLDIKTKNNNIIDDTFLSLKNEIKPLPLLNYEKDIKPKVQKIYDWFHECNLASELVSGRITTTSDWNRKSSEGNESNILKRIIKKSFPELFPQNNQQSNIPMESKITTGKRITYKKSRGRKIKRYPSSKN